MLYLILAIAASAAVTLVLRAVGNGAGNRYGVLLGNYLTCVVLALMQCLRNPSPVQGVTVLCGICGGVLFVLGLVMMQRSIQVNGASLTGAFSKLGLLVPLALSVLIFRESVSWIRLAGIVTAVAAILVIHSDSSPAKAHRVSTPLLLGTLLGCGSGDAMAKIFEEIGSPTQEPLYFLILFLCASLITFGLSGMERTKTGAAVTARDILGGILVGIPNYASAYLLLGALKRLPALLVYPAVSAGTLLVILILSSVLFQEQLTRRMLGGVCMILMALVLLNL